MKKLLSLAFLLLVGVTFCLAQDSAKQTAVKDAKFNELKHHFGDIPQGKPVTTKFTFENTGKKPLVIETAVASCAIKRLTLTRKKRMVKAVRASSNIEGKCSRRGANPAPERYS